jgi:hypothetical protein
MNREWTVEYWNLMKAGEFGSVYDLLVNNIPKSLFKYRCLSQTTIDSLSNNYVWLADITKLNDPFECSLQFDRRAYLKAIWYRDEFKIWFKDTYKEELTNSEIEKITNSKKPFHTFIDICKNKNIEIHFNPDEQLEEINKKWNQFIEENNADIRVCSFSEINNSLLLWSHYADNHKGICIEYDLLKEDPSNINHLFPMIYCNNIYKLELFEKLTRIQKIGLTINKCKDWEYEKEWRVIVIETDGLFPNKMPVPNPKAVYLGTRFSQNEQSIKDKLFAIFKEKDIPIFQMTKHPDEYKLTELK